MGEIKKRKSLPPEHSLVLGMIRVCSGRTRCISPREISDRLGIQQRRVRRIISELIVNHLQPICTLYGRGYYWPESESEALDAAASLRGHGLQIMQRAESLYRAARTSRQGEL